MSKLDAQRAMREAKYARDRARAQERAPAAGAAARPQATPPPVAPPLGAAEPDAVAAPGPDAESTCGHRSMNGRTCTREAGHPQKNHRYS